MASKQDTWTSQFATIKCAYRSPSIPSTPWVIQWLLGVNSDFLASSRWEITLLGSLKASVNTSNWNWRSAYSFQFWASHTHGAAVPCSNAGKITLFDSVYVTCCTLYCCCYCSSAAASTASTGFLYPLNYINGPIRRAFWTMVASAWRYCSALRPVCLNIGRIRVISMRGSEDEGFRQFSLLSL